MVFTVEIGVVVADAGAEAAGGGSPPHAGAKSAAMTLMTASDEKPGRTRRRMRGCLPHPRRCATREHQVLISAPRTWLSHGSHMALTWLSHAQWDEEGDALRRLLRRAHDQHHVLPVPVEVAV